MTSFLEQDRKHTDIDWELSYIYFFIYAIFLLIFKINTKGIIYLYDIFNQNVHLANSFSMQASFVYLNK